MGGYTRSRKRVRISRPKRRRRLIRRSYKRRRGRGRTGRTLPKSAQVSVLRGWAGSPFPKSLLTSFRYATSIIPMTTQSAPPITDVHHSYLFRLNSMKDPNITGGGLRPRWSASFLGPAAGTAPYYIYAVYAGYINCAFNNLSPSTIYVSITYLRTGTSFPVTLHECRERADTRVLHLSPYTQPGSFKRFKAPYRVAPWYNLKSVAEDPDHFQAAWNGEPTKQLDLLIRMYDQYGNTDTDWRATCQMNLMLKVKLMDRNDVQDSTVPP